MEPSTTSKMADDKVSPDPDTIEEEVMSALLEMPATELEAVCIELELDCSTDIKGKKKLLLRFLLKYV